MLIYCHEIRSMKPAKWTWWALSMSYAIGTLFFVKPDVEEHSNWKEESILHHQRVSYFWRDDILRPLVRRMYAACYETYRLTNGTSSTMLVSYMPFPWTVLTLFRTVVIALVSIYLAKFTAYSVEGGKFSRTNFCVIYVSVGHLLNMTAVALNFLFVIVIAIQKFKNMLRIQFACLENSNRTVVPFILFSFIIVHKWKLRWWNWLQVQREFCRILLDLAYVSSTR